MHARSAPPERVSAGAAIAVVTNRRLDNARSGSAALLKVLFEAARRSGLETFLIVASSAAFSNRPWARVDESFRGAGVAWPRSLRIGSHYISTAPMVWLRFARRLVQALARAFGARVRVRSNLADVPDAAELARLARAVRASGAASVLVEYSSFGPLLAHLPELPNRMVLMHDLFSARAARFRAAGEAPDFIDISIEDEAARCGAATAVFYASIAERDAMEAHLPNARHLWLKPTISVRREALRARAPFVCFIGADHAGNRDAVAHLLADIWPSVVAVQPDARLVVAGRIGDFVPADAANVEAVGAVEDLAQFSGPDCIGVAPIRLGSGLPIKVAEYLSFGMPVVAYKAGIEGFGGRLDGAVMDADNPAQFADMLVRLLQSSELRASLSAAGLERAEAIAADASVEDELERLKRA